MRPPRRRRDRSIDRIDVDAIDRSHRIDRRRSDGVTVGVNGRDRVFTRELEQLELEVGDRWAMGVYPYGY